MHDTDYLMLSGIQHFVFCKRQCALIHLDQLWIDNTHTVLGEALHERVDKPEQETRPGIKIERALQIKSDRLGLIGKADLVEFHKQNSKWLPFPVEYKKGKQKLGLEDKVQLCAQAFCLEEMFDCVIEKGALFYGREKHRTEVHFDEQLKQATIDAATGFHKIMQSSFMPPPEFGSKCKNCSLLEACLPETEGINIDEYLQSFISSK